VPERAPWYLRERAKWQLILLEIVILMATWVLCLVIGGWACSHLLFGQRYLGTWGISARRRHVVDSSLCRTDR
jgi:hypothetical protein